MASVKPGPRRGKRDKQPGTDEGEAVEHVPSAGEALISQLLHKQTNTQVTVDQQLRAGRQFVSGPGHVSVSALCPGVSSAQQLMAASQRAQAQADLQARGLSQAEAVSVLEGEEGSTKAAAHAQAARRDFISRQLQPPTCEPGSDRSEGLSRQEMEEALSVKPGSVETRLYQFAMRNTPASAAASTSTLHPDHPVHRLAELERALVASPPDPAATARTLLRKRRQLVQATGEPQLAGNKPPVGSLWDATECPVVIQKKPHVEKTFTCKKPSLYTVRDGKILQLDEKKDKVVDNAESEKRKPSGQMFVSLESPTQSSSTLKKLSEDEIRQLPRFHNYDRGVVSHTLYIKNLSKNFTEEDLAAVFSHYQHSENKLIFRLMTGKMRGQAFVKFTSCEKATEALEDLNGSIYKGRPMVIQYGKKSDG